MSDHNIFVLSTIITQRFCFFFIHNPVKICLPAIRDETTNATIYYLFHHIFVSIASAQTDMHILVGGIYIFFCCCNFLILYWLTLLLLLLAENIFSPRDVTMMIVEYKYMTVVADKNII